MKPPSLSSSAELNESKMAADWISDLESDNSRIAKEKVIEKALIAARLGSSSAQAFLYNCYLAYNPFYVYGVKQVPETKDITGKSNSWPDFWKLIEKLRTGGLTGNRARDAIEELSEQFDSYQWNGLARRVLIKDLRVGITSKTLNKILGNSEYAIPVFECQLATDSKDKLDKLHNVYRLEPKLDGVRVLAVWHNGEVTTYSRNGKPFHNFGHIVEQIESAARRLAYVISSGRSFVLDGEVVGESFQALMKQAHRKHDASADDSVFVVFDYIPFADFQAGFWNMSQHKRRHHLERAQTLFDEMPNVQLSDGVDDVTPDQIDFIREYANDTVAQGYEGIMIKDITAPYECKRNKSWLKWKPVIEVSLEVVELEEGTGRNEGRLGALVCEGVDAGKHIRVNVGSGLTDDNRDEYWEAKESIVGQIVEVQADAITQNQDGSYSLRFPRFKTFRGFESGEKL